MVPFARHLSRTEATMDVSTLHELATRREVAEFLRTHDSTIDRLVKTGQLEAVKFGATVRIPRESVEKFLSAAKSAEPVTSRTRRAARGAECA